MIGSFLYLFAVIPGLLLLVLLIGTGLMQAAGWTDAEAALASVGIGLLLILAASVILRGIIRDVSARLELTLLGEPMLESQPGSGIDWEARYPRLVPILRRIEVGCFCAWVILVLGGFTLGYAYALWAGTGGVLQILAMAFTTWILQGFVRMLMKGRLAVPPRHR